MKAIGIIRCPTCKGSGKYLSRWYSKGGFIAHNMDSDPSQEAIKLRDERWLERATKDCKHCAGTGKVTAQIVEVA